MKKIASLKVQAQNLKAVLAEQGIILTQGQALETIAKQYGAPNWDTLCGMLKKPVEPVLEPRLSDLPFVPEGLWLEIGMRTSRCHIEKYDTEALALLHDEALLRAHLEAHADQYEGGIHSPAIALIDDGMDAELTFQMLLGIRYVRGMRWQLKDGTKLEFCQNYNLRIGAGRSAREELELKIPEAVKSVKSVQLVKLCSHDGAAWDLHVLVPAHLHVAVITHRFEVEIRRLKERDRLNFDNPELDPSFEEYTAVELRTFAQSIGCSLPEIAEVATENWD